MSWPGSKDSAGNHRFAILTAFTKAQLMSSTQQACHRLGQDGWMESSELFSLKENGDRMVFTGYRKLRGWVMTDKLKRNMIKS